MSKNRNDTRKKTLDWVVDPEPNLASKILILSTSMFIGGDNYLHSLNMAKLSFHRRITIILVIIPNRIQRAQELLLEILSLAMWVLEPMFGSGSVIVIFSTPTYMCLMRSRAFSAGKQTQSLSCSLPLVLSSWPKLYISFCFFVWFCITPGDVQGLLRNLQTGFSPGGIWDIVTKPGSTTCETVLYQLDYLSSSPKVSFYF